jgi:hypothetical protein
MGDLMYYGIDGSVKYSNECYQIKSYRAIVVTWWRLLLGKSSFGTINPGAGLTLWFSDHVGLALETTYTKAWKWRPISSFSLSTYCRYCFQIWR